MSFDGLMSDVWAVRNEQPIFSTSTHPCMTRSRWLSGVKPASLPVCVWHACSTDQIKCDALPSKLTYCDPPSIYKALYINKFQLPMLVSQLTFCCSVGCRTVNPCIIFNGCIYEKCIKCLFLKFGETNNYTYNT